MGCNTNVLVAVILAFPAAARASSEFDGTWKTDLSSTIVSSRPDEFSLVNGTYQCVHGCHNNPRVPADGVDHAEGGSPFYDTIAVQVVNDRTVYEADKKGGHVVNERISSVSKDDRTLTIYYINSAETNGGPPMTGTITETRDGKAPQNGHAISGRWKQVGLTSSDNQLIWSMKLEGDQLTLKQATGQSYTAQLGGPDAPYFGDLGVTSVAVRKVGSHAIEEIDKKDGKVVSTTIMTVSADGKTLISKTSDKVSGQDTTWKATKQ